MKKLLLSVLLTVVFAVPAFSQMMDMPMKGQQAGGGHMMGMGQGGGMGHGGAMGHGGGMGTMAGMCLGHADKIGLTDEQIKKIMPIHREMEKKQARFTADRKIAKIELMEIMDVKGFDLRKASAAVKKIGDIKTAHHLEMLKSMKEMLPILTDEQYNKMKKMMNWEMGGRTWPRR